jgi:hypothetical protein
VNVLVPVIKAGFISVIPLAYSALATSNLTLVLDPVIAIIAPGVYVTVALVLSTRVRDDRNSEMRRRMRNMRIDENEMNGDVSFCCHPRRGSLLISK